MLHLLRINNVGPVNLSMKYAPRLNLITGDNGLGKSFLLDIVWWCMTQTWPRALNPKLVAGRMAVPRNREANAEIEYTLDLNDTEKHICVFERENQSWGEQIGLRSESELVFYAMSDGSMAIWDPARNLRRDKNVPSSQALGYALSPLEIWNGLKRGDDAWFCNGLIRDWTLWQSQKGPEWNALTSVLSHLSCDECDSLRPGTPVRVSIEDSRDIPTLEMSYQQNVPIIHASSGIQRIVSLAYLLVWCWEEHQKASTLLGASPCRKMVFLFDEVESHLHPKWQRTIIPALMSVMRNLGNNIDVQLIAVTHSPLIMGSVENIFNPELDSWYDLDMDGQNVVLSQRDYEKQGEYGNWLKSQAFDLKTSYNFEAEQAIREASEFIDSNSMDADKAQQITQRLSLLLPAFDPYLRRWLYLSEHKGWLS